ncbi:AraC family transcriptional regulator [Paenibacillus swuensis]|uniref:AraC family transcriptional regulator n=1 Tax=Paenibacillus swuensis TaxID=1178515 RepID=UPI001E4DBE14|nr:AraC family transcriptional regulator [Paenibacillus swuensis]
MSLKIFQSDRTDDVATTNWHYHKELEILLVLEGSLEVEVEDTFYSLSKGDIVLIGASQLHRDRSTGFLDYVVLQFDIQQFLDQNTLQYIRYFSDPQKPLSHFNHMLENNEDVKQTLVGCIKDILKEATAKEEGYEIAVNIRIKQMLLTLLRNDNERQLNRRDDFDLVRLKPVLDYIEENINGKVLVEDASKVANISYYYFVKYFKKVLGMSFTEYVNYKKIKRAEQLLLTKDLSIALVGEEIGMPNMAHFYKIFKKYNDCSPNEFRKKMLDWSHHERVTVPPV